YRDSVFQYPLQACRSLDQQNRRVLAEKGSAQVPPQTAETAPFQVWPAHGRAVLFPADARGGAFCSATQPFKKSAERFYSSPCSETRRGNSGAVRPFAALAPVPSRNAKLIG